MTHAPIPDPAIEQERRRLGRLRLLAVLDTGPEPLFDGLVNLAASICGTPISLVSLVDDRRQWFKANLGLEGMAETDRGVAFCAHAIQGDDVMEVGDATRDGRFASNPMVLGEPGIRFYAGAPITMPGGERIGTLCVIDRRPRELTPEQRRSLRELAVVAREALLQREELHYMRMASDESRFKAILEGAPLGIFQANQAGDVFFTNPRWQEIFGLGHDEGLQRRWLETIHPEDRGRVTKAWLDAAAAGTMFDEEFRILKHGEPVHVRSSARAVSWGRPLQRGIVGIAADISQRTLAEAALRSSEERQKRALDASRLALWDLDLETGRLYLSENWSDLMGGPRQPLVTTFEALADQVPEEDQRTIELALSQALKGTSERYDVEHRIRRYDGTEIWIHSEGRVTRRDGEGRALHATGTNQDITDRKTVEVELTRAKEAAEAANEAKTDFLATMSHEIRTPLNGVLGITRLLLRDVLEPQQKRYVSLIDNSAHSLLALINDLLDLGKIEAGQVVLEHVPFSIENLLADLTELYTLRASEKSLLFRTAIAPDVPPWLAGDPNRLRQILSNLLSNALKFTAAGEVGLAVELKSTKAGWVRLAFAVRDTGIGIAPHVQAQLFSRFVQADSSTTREYGGSGLGLAIVKQLSEMMGGGAQLQSSPGQGSVFRCEIPFEVVQAPREPQRAHALESATARPERLLIAEDNSTNQIVVQGMLAHIGFDNIAIVHNGQEALDAFADGGFAAILMDCHMPVMDGFEATERLRAAGCRLPIIAMTASATSADRAKCLRVGMDDYLSKPLDTVGLQKVLERWLGAPAATADARADTPRSAAGPEPASVVPAFEREAALHRLGDDEELLGMVVASFIAETPRAMDNLKQALRDGAHEVVHRRLHTLAGSSATVGAAAVHQAARAMGIDAAAGNLAAVTAKLPGLERLIEAFQEQAATPAAPPSNG